jgi:hypothetical protein
MTGGVAKDDGKGARLRMTGGEAKDDGRGWPRQEGVAEDDREGGVEKDI